MVKLVWTLFRLQEIEKMGTVMGTVHLFRGLVCCAFRDSPLAF